MKKPLTVLRFVVPANISEIPFALREAGAYFVDIEIAPKMFTAHLQANIGKPVTVAFTSQYGKEAKQNLDYLAAKIRLAGGTYEAARDLYPLPHGQNKIDELLALASFPVSGPSFVEQPSLLLIQPSLLRMNDAA